MQNFMVADLVQTTFAIIVFALFFLPSGYLLGLASNVFGFRTHSAAEKLLFSIALSFAATPILTVLLTRLSSYKVTLAVFLLFAAICAATVIRQFPLPGGFFSGIRSSTWVLVSMSLAWFVVVQFSLADMEIGHRLYVNYVAYDHSVRVPFVEAAARNGVPLLNPFFGLGKAPVLRYYYYWYVVCALPMQLFGLGAKACLNASVFWSGLGVASTIPLFLKYFLRETEHLRRKSVIGIALLTVTGLDLLPYSAIVMKFHLWPGDMEWWDSNQVSSWLGSLLWVPHHVASLTACMVGLLVLSTIDEQISFRQRAWAMALCGLAFASAVGLSVYVTFTFAVFAIFWALLVLLRREIRTFATYIAACALSLLLSGPYLFDLLSKPESVPGQAHRFVFFAIRDFPLAVEFLRNSGIHNGLLLGLLNVPILVIVYVFEFGFFFLIAALSFRRDARNWGSLSTQRRMAWTMFAVCLLTMSTMQSDATKTNDLGFRGMLVVQFVLLLWAVPVVHEVFFRRDAAAPASGSAMLVKLTLVVMIGLGVAGTAFQLVALRSYAPMADVGKLARSENFLGSTGFGERTYLLREGFSRLDRFTLPGASVQYNPASYEVIMNHLYSTRQAAVGDEDCGTAFGGDILRCRKAYPYVNAVFNSPDTVRDWNLDRFCDDFFVNVLVATDTDPIWQDPNSWVWTRPSLLSNSAMRATSCGSGVPTSTR